ncbi:MAG: hypothetical protein IKL68_00915 [Clostridia bacterium]|nr:hypothetical protein [Clostridia bacterium]
MIFEKRKSQLGEEIREVYVKLPFDIYSSENKSVFKVKELVEEVEERFELLRTNDKINIKLYLAWIEALNITNVEEYIFSNLKLKDKELDILLKRINFTLEELGKEYGITRERIRQIEAKAVRKVNLGMEKIFFDVINKEKMYFASELTKLENIMMYIDSITEQSYISYGKGEDMCFIPVTKFTEIKRQLKDVEEELEENGYVKYDISDYPELKSKCIEYLGLNYINGCVTKITTKQEQVKYGMRYLGRPIKISSEQDQKELVQAVKQIFGTELPIGRSLEALINNVGARVDSGSYSGYDSALELPKEVLAQIEEYIKEKQIINARDLFAKFGEVLNAHNLNNETILYRYLKEKLDGKLYFHGVSAVISSKKDMGSWGEVVKQEILSTKRPAEKTELMIKYAMTEAVYNTLAVNFSDIIIWGRGELYLKSLVKLPEKLEEMLMNAICERQILSFSEIRGIMNKYDNKFLEENNIKTNENLYHYLKTIELKNVIIDKNANEVILQSKKATYEIEEYKETEELTI